MGTSSASRGASSSTPLVPSWADEPSAPIDGPLDPSGAAPPVAAPPPPTTPEPAHGPSDRWRDARAQYTKFARSGGTGSRALLNALAGYIGRSLGGAGTAARRMSASQAAARELGGVVGDFATRGVEPTLRDLGLGDLVGRPLAEVLVTVLERVCPPGATVDEAIAREAYLQAVIECTPTEGSEEPQFNEELALRILESFATNSICLRVINDIGTKGLDVSPSVITALNVEEQLREFVQGAVHDAIAQVRGDGGSLDRVEASRIADELYPVAWEVLEALAKKGGEE